MLGNPPDPAANAYVRGVVNGDVKHSRFMVDVDPRARKQGSLSIGQGSTDPDDVHEQPNHHAEFTSTCSPESWSVPVDRQSLPTREDSHRKVDMKARRARRGALWESTKDVTLVPVTLSITT